jgi:hypothetical protein
MRFLLGMLGACIGQVHLQQWIARYKLHLMCAQKVSLDKGGRLRAGDYILFCGKINENLPLGIGVLCTTGCYQQLIE